MGRFGASVLARIPPPILKLVTWLQGPGQETQLEGPKPWLSLNLTLNSRQLSIAFEPLVLRWTRWFASVWLFILFAAAYIVGLSFLARAQWYQTPPSSFIDCLSTYWLANDGCGLDGVSCLPFNSSEPFEFRCPAACPNVILANNRAIGAEEVRYVPLVVGGGDSQQTYRADSWICVAAVHAGVVSAGKGGCGVLQQTGEYTNFPGVEKNGIQSTSFPSAFPSSFRFLSSATNLSHCTDLRDEALVYNVLSTAFLFLVLRPKPIVLFWCLVCIGFWHITFFSDPRATPVPISEAFGAFLPTLFVCYAFYRSTFRFVLPTFTNLPIERAIWYLGAFWPGVLLNVVTDKVPLDRLVASDIAQRPGALTALIIIIIVITMLALNQVWVIRKTGLLLKYLGWYIIGGLVIMVLALLPGLTFRLHHYIFAMLLLPGTFVPTRVSAVVQAFLLGMFLNGVSRWGFDSILQTADELRRDAPLGSSLPSFVISSLSSIAPTISNSSVISWSPIPSNITSEGWSGFSLLIDDVERYVGTALNVSLAALTGSLGSGSGVGGLDWSVPHFFRLAYQTGDTSGDYTRAATIWPNGTVVEPEPGPS